VRLTPRALDGQTRRWSEISIVPTPAVVSEQIDYFGNAVTFFTLEEPHGRLIVEATSETQVAMKNPPDFAESMHWELVRDNLASDHSNAGLDAYQFVFDSRRAEANPKLYGYARESFPAGQPLLQGVSGLMRRIHEDFRFDTEATEVTTPLDTFFEKRRGVCQDFAHLQIACLRTLGLPARYVSGYLRTLPPPGQPRIIGADASHAWCSAWCPGVGWVDFDPTNNCLPSDGHITVAWGRDYGDVSPIHGVLLGGARHKLEVEVDVAPIE
jgi:transglutaminase-like putative cysteine protease